MREKKEQVVFGNLQTYCDKSCLAYWGLSLPLPVRVSLPPVPGWFLQVPTLRCIPRWRVVLAWFPNSLRYLCVRWWLEGDYLSVGGPLDLGG